MSRRSPILIVEDSREDYEATLRSWTRCARQAPDIQHCVDGDDALDYLYGRGRYDSDAESDRPALIILDLNLPGTGGLEVLQQLKQDRALRSIPVVVLSTSNDPTEVEECYDAGANSYVQKPSSLHEYFRIVESIEQFWVETVLLPSRA